jgi:hypothetical protein
VRAQVKKQDYEVLVLEVMVNFASIKTILQGAGSSANGQLC